MFRSSSARQSELAEARLAKHLNYWARTAATWFDGTPASVEERTATLDRIITFARDTVARLGSTSAGRHCVAALPELEQHRRELAVARGSLLNGFSDRQAGSLVPAGRRTAKPGTAGPSGRQPDDPHPQDDDAPHFAEYKGKCPQCKSDNIDHAYYPGSGEYDCSDCGATFHPKVRRLKSRVATPKGLKDKTTEYGKKPSKPSGSSGGYEREPRDTAEQFEMDQDRREKEGFFNSGLHRAVELGTREFLAAQNTDDHDELIFRARRYAEEQTSTLPMPTAHALAAAFVDRVEQRIAQRPRQRQAARQVTAYQDFDDSLLY